MMRIDQGGAAANGVRLPPPGLEGLVEYLWLDDEALAREMPPDQSDGITAEREPGVPGSRP